jgi:hypothetical protein
MEIGSSHSFVIAQGFRQVGEHWGLIGHDGSLRLFAQLTADPDRPAVRPVEAYRALLASLQPGWTLRWLQIFWPDPIPRKKFFEHAQNWNEQGGEGEGHDLLRQGLLLFIQEAPLPFVRRTILEFVSPGQEGQALRQSSHRPGEVPVLFRGVLPGGQAWWNGLPGLLGTYGVRVEPLSLDEIQELARWIFNPDLE